MAKTADIKNGICIKHNDKLFTVIDFQHVKPGKGPAFVRTKLKNLDSGKVVDHTFSAGHSIEMVRIEYREYQYLYAEDEGYHFMNNQTFDQVFIKKELVDNYEFLKEGLMVNIVFHAEEELALKVELPPFVEAIISYTEPGLRGDTATNTLKPATLDTGAEIRVPLFINQGDKIKIDTRTREYYERIK